MKAISYYISDHGFGHASRSIAIIRKIIEERKDVKIIVNCERANTFVKKSFNNHRRIFIRSVKNDFGYITDNKLNILKRKTQEKLNNFIQNSEYYIKNEIDFFKNKKVDMIISDICPTPFEISHRCNIPSIAISNFTWWEVYKDFFGNTTDVQKIKEFYEKANLGLILPMETDNLPFKNLKKIGLVTRDINIDYQNLRKTMGIVEDIKLIFISLGKSHINDKKINLISNNKLKEKIKILVSSGNRSIKNYDYQIPEKITESQNYINASDMILTKFGYSTISEGIRSLKPIVLFKRNVIEDEQGFDKIKNVDFIKLINRDDFFNGNWFEDFVEIIEKKYDYDSLPKRLKTNGSEEIINLINEFI